MELKHHVMEINSSDLYTASNISNQALAVTKLYEISKLNQYLSMNHSNQLPNLIRLLNN
jgi:hypothetical protein